MVFWACLGDAFLGVGGMRYGISMADKGGCILFIRLGSEYIGNRGLRVLTYGFF